MWVGDVSPTNELKIDTTSLDYLSACGALTYEINSGASGSLDKNIATCTSAADSTACKTIVIDTSVPNVRTVAWTVRQAASAFTSAISFTITSGTVTVKCDSATSLYSPTYLF